MKESNSRFFLYVFMKIEVLSKNTSKTESILLNQQKKIEWNLNKKEI